MLNLRAERDHLAEQVAVEEALMEGASPEPPDTFAGRRVLTMGRATTVAWRRPHA